MCLCGCFILQNTDVSDICGSFSNWGKLKEKELLLLMTVTFVVRKGLNEGDLASSSLWGTDVILFVLIEAILISTSSH